LPVVASADGYINRITVQTGGYGNALYIQHPDGNITVYAHLNHFNKEIADFVRQEQYKRQKFELNLFPPKGQFEVKQGDLIAFSGNSGSSGGPHVHFDIRDKNQNLLNPLEFGLTEIHDNIPPVARRIALIPINKSSRVEGEFNRYEFNLVKTRNEFVSRDTIRATGVIGIELYAYDRQNYTFFRTGIPTIKLFVNNQQIFNQNIVEFSFADQRTIQVHTDYQKKLSSGRSYSKLFIADGNTLPFFQSLKKGYLFVKQGRTYTVRIELKDSYNNESISEFVIKGSNDFAEKAGYPVPENMPAISQNENTLKLVSYYDSLSNGKATLFIKGKPLTLLPDYITPNRMAVFLWDLRQSLPDSVEICNSKKYFNFKATVFPGAPYQFYSDIMDISFTKNSLFDTLYLTTNYYINQNQFEIFQINNNVQPIKSSIKVTLKPKGDYTSKSAVYGINRRGDISYAGGSWDGKFITFYVSEFGDYTIATDSVAPKIIPISINKESLTLKIEDKMSGLKEFRATVDGKWVLMNYDYKKNLLWSEKLNPEIPFSGDFVLTVTDNAGNSSVYKTNL